MLDRSQKRDGPSLLAAPVALGLVCLASFVQLAQTFAPPLGALDRIFAAQELRRGHWLVAPHTLLTYALFHAHWTHFALNAAVLLLLGHAVERGLGSLRYALVCVGGALGAAAGFLLIAPAGVAAVGASGVAFALLGAAVVMRLTGGETLEEGDTIQRPVGSPGRTAIVAALVLIAGFRNDVSVALAHAGGCAAGFVLAGPVSAEQRRVMELSFRTLAGRLASFLIELEPVWLRLLLLGSAGFSMLFALEPALWTGFSRSCDRRREQAAVAWEAYAAHIGAIGASCDVRRVTDDLRSGWPQYYSRPDCPDGGDEAARSLYDSARDATDLVDETCR
jgi:membrane associated rhomboid family serine protease